MIAKKLLVNDKITACVKRIRVLVAICRFQIEKQSGETFCILEKHLLSIFEFCALINPWLLIAPQPTFLACIVIFL